VNLPTASRIERSYRQWRVGRIYAIARASWAAGRCQGIDGVGRFILGTGEVGKVLVSVKGGKNHNPGMVSDPAMGGQS
jgi:hypothetical protein